MRPWLLLGAVFLLFLAGMALSPELAAVLKADPDGSDLLFLAFALVAALAAFFNPCAFAAYPAFVSLVVASRPKEKNWVLALTATAGLLAFYLMAFLILAGLGTGVAGFLIQTRWIAGIFFVILGAVMVFEIPTLSIRVPLGKVEGAPGFFSLGFLYGVTGAFCTTPILVTIFVLPLATNTLTVLEALVLFLAASAGLMWVATRLALKSQHALSGLAAYSRHYRRATGLILWLAAAYLLAPYANL